MSKYSLMQNSADKLQEAVIEDFKAKVMGKADDLPENEMAALEKEYFQFVENDFRAAERTGYSNYSYWGSTFKMFAKNKMGMANLIILVLLVGFAIIQPVLPGQRLPTWIHNDPATGWPIRNVPPFQGEFFLGTNAIGQCIWARIWGATRNSLGIGFAVGIISMFVGIVYGMLWGYIRKLEFLFMEIFNIISNVPTIIQLILASMILRPSIPVLIGVMAFNAWPGHAVNIRNLVLMFRDREFNLASRCLGTGVFKVIVRNLLPQMISIMMLRIALAVPAAIGSEAFLSFLGLGISEAQPTLGNMLNTGRRVMMAPTLRYQLIIPAVVMIVVSTAFYLAGNAFADSADPRNHT